VSLVKKRGRFVGALMGTLIKLTGMQFECSRFMMLKNSMCDEGIDNVTF
jgi:hypothetical protein